MKAIDILFAKIDELNSKIKSESDMKTKVFLAAEIKEIIEIISSINELRRFDEDYI